MVKTYQVKTSGRQEMINISRQVHESIEASGIIEGICTVFIPHTTAGVTINENADPDVVRDMLIELDKIVPLQDGYHHYEGNSAAHIKASMMGASLQVIVSEGRPLLGTWQGIYFCEFDGPRTRKFHVSVH